MKKLFPIIILAITLLTSTFTINNAEDYTQGDIIGHVYATDIKAFIDDMPIPSYNIGGKTVVSEFDLHNYGFDIVWDADNRVLEINSGTKPENAPPYTEQKLKTSNHIIADVYYTDINVWFNSYYIDAYDIGGETLICLEDLGKEIEDTRLPNHNREIGYSNLGIKTIWNPESRTIHSYSFNVGNYLTTDYGDFKIKDTISSYNPTIASFHPYYLSTFFARDNNHSNIQFLSITDLFTFERINYTFTNGQLKVQMKSVVENRFYSRTAHTNDSNAVLPIVTIPIQLTNEKNEVTNFIVDAAIYKGEPHFSISDLKDYFDISYSDEKPNWE